MLPTVSINGGAKLMVLGRGVDLPWSARWVIALLAGRDWSGGYSVTIEREGRAEDRSVPAKDPTQVWLRRSVASSRLPVTRSLILPAVCPSIAAPAFGVSVSAVPSCATSNRNFSQ